ncbi:hypothetical protein COY51_05470 [Candidatus Desantisbacteria bacterium CG_4_10_14_0_8_um_filter_39_17]|uniref:Gfo/Idh/MocA family oxidoreductase n=1 Tax=Candidatus Desantisbacteria bacterium CG_4_10_14_0_8_um_filter_39_17 TaxID=1974542 RepID=A0A2H9PBW4_9BACT|nr:MAG: hypothetical protein COY51_05470 [Candidatus Desantisbacteria bacterium CG_4_10_14_0_8_um_filter_39_17]
MVKVGIIGAGFMGGMHSQCYKVLENAKLVAIADSQLNKAQELANKYGAKAYGSADDLLADKEIQAVDICLPTFMHKEYVIKVAQAKKHVLCEKPIALTLKDADEMIAAAAKDKVKFMIAQVIRFWPEYVKLKEIVDSKQLGKIISLTCCRLSPTPTWAWQNWLGDAQKSGGALVDLHIHDVDYLYYLLGRPTSLFAQGRKVGEGYNHIWCTFKFKDGVTGFAEGGWDLAAQFPFTATFTAVFEKGVVEFDCRREKSLAIYTSEKTEYPRIESMTAEDVGGNVATLGGYFEEIKYFVNCVDANQEPTVVTSRDARNSLEIILLEIKSAMAGKVIKT